MANTPTKPIRFEPKLWEDFGSALPALEVSDRSAYVRQCIEYALRRPGAKRPARLTEDQARGLFGEDAE